MAGKTEFLFVVRWMLLLECRKLFNRKGKVLRVDDYPSIKVKRETSLERFPEEENPLLVPEMKFVPFGFFREETDFFKENFLTIFVGKMEETHCFIFLSSARNRFLLSPFIFYLNRITQFAWKIYRFLVFFVANCRQIALTFLMVPVRRKRHRGNFTVGFL